MNQEPIRAQALAVPQPNWPDKATLAAEQEALATEAMGWQKLEAGVYLHQGCNELVVQIVGQAHTGMQDHNVLWLIG
jgi:hypothetical protein